jgi:hypothetical protein
VAQDNFFPNNTKRAFVNATGPKPLTAAKVQLQAQIINQKPLLSYTKWGSSLALGARAQGVFSGYLSNEGVDGFSLLRAGPNVNLNIKKPVGSQLQLWSATTMGKTPFVFDSYFRGSQNLSLTNQVRVNNYLTVGWRNDLNLLKDNARGDLMVGNAAFMMVGPPEVKIVFGV